jgi:hypothetical protein
MAREGAVIIPDVPIGLLPGTDNFLRAVKQALDVLQGSGKAPESRRAPTLAEIAGVRLVNRGDPAAWDFTSLTTDGNWHDLDLSRIVPAGAVAVLLRADVNDDALGSYFQVRQKGNANLYNSAVVRSQAASVTNDGTGIICFVGPSRVVEYAASNLTFVTLSVLVRGWWI